MKRNIKTRSYKLAIVSITAMMILLLVPSMTFADGVDKTVCTYTYDEDGSYSSIENGQKYEGTIEEPIVFQTSYDEIIVTYSDNSDDDRFVFPFYFSFEHADYKYVKYLVNIIQTEKKVVFKRLNTTNTLGDFIVTPNKETVGWNFIQPGGVYNENFDPNVFSPPLYKIESQFKFNVGTGFADDTAYKIETILGNSTYKSGAGQQSGDVSNQKVYVFCVNGLTENEIAKFAQDQIDKKAVITVKAFEDDFGLDKEEVKNYKAIGEYKIKDITSQDGSEYEFSSSATGEVVYAFWGLTSEVLNDNEVNEIEEILTKLLLSVGGMFRAVVSAVGGSDLTMDALIFNQYEKTILDFWGNTGTYTDVFSSIINGWYKAFSGFAKVILVIILVAMGVMTLFYAGTSKEKKVQTMLVGWVLAVGLLYLGPYFMKYAVMINDTFVEIIRGQSKYSVYSVYNADFLSEYNLSGEMQIGEDSETVKVQDVLLKLYSTIEEELSEAQEEQAEAVENIEKIKSKWVEAEAGDDRVVKLVDENIAAGEKERYLTKDHENGNKAAFDVVDEFVQNNPEATEAEIDEFVNKLTSSVDSEFISGDVGDWLSQGWTDLTNGDAKLQAELREQLKSYINSSLEVQKHSEALEATKKALELANKGIDLESIMKERAGETYRIVYVLVWFIMIYQLVLLLFLYYKRLVVTAVLITIYPLVIMMYAFEKLMGIDKSQSLKIWLTEFLVNIFVQSVHALIYIMLVEAGLRAFEDDADNWLLFLFATLAIFPAENIIKSIMGMKAKSVGSLSDYSNRAVALAAVAATAKAALGNGKQIDAKYNAKENKIAARQSKMDKAKETFRTGQDNRLLKKATGRGASAEDARRRLEQRNEARKAFDERKTLRRKKAQARRMKRKKLEKKLQPFKNIEAMSKVITTGLAGGGDPGDFGAGVAIAKATSGSNKKASVSASKGEPKTGKSGNTPRYGTRSGNGSSGANNGSQTSTTNTNNSGQSAAPNYGNGRTTPTYREHRAEARRRKASSDIQNACRAKIAQKQVRQSTPIVNVLENDDGEE